MVSEMSICDVSEVVPKALMNVIPDAYKGMRYKRMKVGDKITIHDVCIVTYPAKSKSTGDPIIRKDGSQVYNQTVYFGIGDGKYSSLRNEKALGQIAQLVGWYETDPGDAYYTLDKPESVEIIETTVKMGNKEVPVLAFKSV